MRHVHLVLLCLAALGNRPAGAAPRSDAAPPGFDPRTIHNEARRLPRLVFVSRRPAPAGTAPGFGPGGRDRARGGRLLVREPNGRIHPLGPEAAFYDVGDPCPDWDARRIVFAATPAPGAPWSLWVMKADGTGLERVTSPDSGFAPDGAGRLERLPSIDIDPCWLPDGRICFASTRWRQRSQSGGLAVTNLFVTELGGAVPLRITSERNGAEEPHVDPRTGRIVYARWWFNRFLPADDSPWGITLDRAHAVPQDTINSWTAASIAPDGEGVRLAGGDARQRPSLMAQEPILLRDGSLVGVWAENPTLYPESGRTGIQICTGGFTTVRGIGPARRLAGPGTLLPGSACGPAELPDGRLLFAWDPSARSAAPGSADCDRQPADYGIYVMKRDGSGVARVVDLPGTDEFDVAVLARRAVPPVLPIDFPQPPLTTRPIERADEARDVGRNTFRFDCGNVFANAPVDAAIPDAPRAERGLRIRFFATLSRPQADGGDSLVLLREAPVEPSGAIHVDDILADSPTFEQLVDSTGQVVRTARGPAHVAGFNFARQGGGTKCMGCHPGHSVIPAPVNNWQAKWFNAAPSAAVEATSEGGGRAQAAVDRRTLGPPAEVCWVASGATGEALRLVWNQQTIEVRCVVLYSVPSAPEAGTTLRVQEARITLLRGNREVERLRVRRQLSPHGTRIDFDPVLVDAIEIAPVRVSGLVARRRVAALAEVEVIARIPED